MRFECFFWDYDGTLMDSYPRITRAFLRGAASLGIALDNQRLMGLAKVSIRHMTQVIAREYGVPEESLRQAYAANAGLEGFQALRLYEGVPSLLAAIVAHGGSNFLYTHSGSEVLTALEHFGVKRYFRDFVTAEDQFPSKPAPDALLYLIDKHHLDVSRCVMLGDRDIDVASGLNAGMAGVLFDPDGYYDDMRIDYRFRSMRAMEEALVEEKALGL